MLRNRVRTALAALLMLLGTLLLLFYALDQEPAQGQPSASSAVRGIPPPLSTVPTSTPSRVADESAIMDVVRPGWVRIEVTDATLGVPLVGAQVCVVSETKRSYAKNEITTLGATDASGAIECPAPQVSTFKSIIASREGYQSAQVPLVQRQLLYRIVLQEGATLRVQCVDRRAMPIRGVKVLLCSGTLDRTQPIRTDVVPSGDAAIALYSEESTAQGEVRMAGLPLGECYLHVEHPQYVLVDGYPSGPFMLGKGHKDLKLTFDPIFGVLAQVSGDELIEACVNFRGTLVSPGVSPEYLAALRARFVGGHPNTFCALGCPPFTAQGGYQAVPSSVTIKTLTARRGWLTIDAPVKPAINLIAPHTVDVGAFPDDATMGSITVACTDALGNHRSLRLRLMSTERHATGGGGTPIPVASGRATPLPAGTYAFAGLPRLASHDELDCKVVAGKHAIANLKFNEPLVRVRFIVTDSSGLEVCMGTVRLQSGAKTATFAFTDRLSDYVYLLPAGTIRGQVWPPGCEMHPFAFDIPYVQDDVLQELAILVQRK